MEIRPNIRAPGAAGRADETVRDVGQSDVIRPLFPVHLYRMAAFIIGAIDQQLADAHLTHLAEGDLLGLGGHQAVEARPGLPGNRPGPEGRVLLISY